MLNRGVATGVYRYIYPQNQSTLNFFMWLFCLLDQDKFDIVQFIPTQIKFLATPLMLKRRQAGIVVPVTCFLLGRAVFMIWEHWKTKLRGLGTFPCISTHFNPTNYNCVCRCYMRSPCDPVVFLLRSIVL